MYNNDSVTDNIDNIDDLEFFLIELYSLNINDNLTWEDGSTYT